MRVCVCPSQRAREPGYACVRARVCVSVSVCARARTQTRLFVYVRTPVFMNVCVGVLCVRVCVSVCVCLS